MTRKCKGNPEWEREGRAALAPLRAISKETGVPMGSLQAAGRLLEELDSASLSRIQKQCLIGKRIVEAYRNGYETGRQYQRRFQLDRSGLEPNDARELIEIALAQDRVIRNLVAQLDLARLRERMGALRLSAFEEAAQQSKRAGLICPNCAAGAHDLCVFHGCHCPCLENPEVTNGADEAEKRTDDAGAGTAGASSEAAGGDAQASVASQESGVGEPQQPPGEPQVCSKCGRSMSDAEGGKIFTVCDVCWPVEQPPAPVLDGLFDHLDGCRAPEYGECTCPPPHRIARNALAWAYQAIGALWPHKEALDNLSAVLQGKMPPHEWPVVEPAPPVECQKAKALADLASDIRMQRPNGVVQYTAPLPSVVARADKALSAPCPPCPRCAELHRLLGQEASRLKREFIDEFVDDHGIICDCCQHILIDVTAVRTGAKGHCVFGDPEGAGLACADGWAKSTEAAYRDLAAEIQYRVTLEQERDSLRAELAAEKAEHAKTTAAWAEAADDRDAANGKLAAEREKVRDLVEALKPVADKVRTWKAAFPSWTRPDDSLTFKFSECERAAVLVAQHGAAPESGDEGKEPR